MYIRSPRTIVAAALAVLFASTSQAQEFSSDVLAQMSAIASAKASLTPTQKKMDSRLVFGIYKATGDARVAAFTNAIAPLSATDLAQPTVVTSGVPADSTSLVTVDIVAPVTSDLNGAIAAANGRVLYQSARFNRTTAAVPVTALTTLAALPSVDRVKLPSTPRSNVGAVTSQGVVAHASNVANASLHVDGTGVSVGVLSDSASATRVAALIASGDLPANTTVLPGQAGPSSGEDEGTAMMEIIHDLAPGAKLYFATAFTSDASFADNIIALAAAGCKVIVDDVSYSEEFAFQDGIIAQAVNQVTAAGVIYFSSAANSGSLTKGTSGTWEGDFLDGGAVSGAVGSLEGGVGRYHNFRTAASPQNYDVLTGSTTDIVLHWSDPVGASANDYDLFILNASGTSVIGFSGEVQEGTGDPIEEAYNPNGYAVNSRVVVVKYSGAARAMHIDTERGTLSIATSGATIGHNAGLNTVSMAATAWNSAKTGTKPFTGSTNTTETFSSDGPRKIFFRPDGTPITPNNFLFATGGGQTLQKPDLTAADGVTTRTPGFNPFFGTSAAAPHAAAIAALVRSARPDYTVAQTKTAMTATALDTVSPGVDRDSGYGITMANGAVSYALSH